MKKQDFKKLAVLGIISGTVMTAQAQAAPVDTIVSGSYLAMGCGSGCRSIAASCGGGQAPSTYYQPQPQGGCHYGSAAPGCGGQRSRSGYTADAYSGATNAMPQSSCGGGAAPNMPQSSCGGGAHSMNVQMNGQPMNTQPMNGQPNQGQMMQPGMMPQGVQAQPGQTSSYNQSRRSPSNRYVSDAGTNNQQQNSDIMSEQERAMMKNQNGTNSTNSRTNSTNTSAPSKY